MRELTLTTRSLILSTFSLRNQENKKLELQKENEQESTTQVRT